MKKRILIGIILILVNVISVNARETIKSCYVNYYHTLGHYNLFTFPEDGSKPFGTIVEHALLYANKLNLELIFEKGNGKDELYDERQFKKVRKFSIEGFKDCLNKMKNGTVDIIFSISNKDDRDDYMHMIKYHYDCQFRACYIGISKKSKISNLKKRIQDLVKPLEVEINETFTKRYTSSSQHNWAENKQPIKVDEGDMSQSLSQFCYMKCEKISINLEEKLINKFTGFFKIEGLRVSIAKRNENDDGWVGHFSINNYWKQGADYIDGKVVLKMENDGKNILNGSIYKVSDVMNKDSSDVIFTLYNPSIYSDFHENTNIYYYHIIFKVKEFPMLDISVGFYPEESDKFLPIEKQKRNFNVIRLNKPSTNDWPYTSSVEGAGKRYDINSDEKIVYDSFKDKGTDIGTGVGHIFKVTSSGKDIIKTCGYQELDNNQVKPLESNHDPMWKFPHKYKDKIYSLDTDNEKIIHGISAEKSLFIANKMNKDLHVIFGGYINTGQRAKKYNYGTKKCVEYLKNGDIDFLVNFGARPERLEFSDVVYDIKYNEKKKHFSSVMLLSKKSKYYKNIEKFKENPITGPQSWVYWKNKPIYYKQLSLNGNDFGASQLSEFYGAYIFTKKCYEIRKQYVAKFISDAEFKKIKNSAKQIETNIIDIFRFNNSESLKEDAWERISMISTQNPITEDFNNNNSTICDGMKKVYFKLIDNYIPAKTIKKDF